MTIPVESGLNWDDTQKMKMPEKPPLTERLIVEDWKDICLLCGYTVQYIGNVFFMGVGGMEEDPREDLTFSPETRRAGDGNKFGLSFGFQYYRQNPRLMHKNSESLPSSSHYKYSAVIHFCSLLNEKIKQDLGRSQKQITLHVCTCKAFTNSCVHTVHQKWAVRK
jgi:hypothetical protein